jgi:transposase
MALSEAAGVSRMPSRRQRVERTATAIGKDGCEGDQPHAVRPNHRPVDDDRTQPTLQAETVTVAAIESGAELLVEAREIVTDFQAMIRRKALAELDLWIERAKTSLVAGFANGVTKDGAAVSAAVSLSWSNDQTEGQICKLKLVKRQMYGRGKLDLLQARVIGAP